MNEQKQRGAEPTKAYRINTSNIREAFYLTDNVYYAETAGKAKLVILEDLRYDDYQDKYGDPLGFLNLKVSRDKNLDKEMFEGELLNKGQISERKRMNEHKAEMLKLIEDNPSGMAYIQKGGYYYRPNHCGYTERLIDAGVYPIEEAVRTVLGCSLRDAMAAIAIPVKEHNEMIQNKIIDLQSRLIV